MLQKQCYLIIVTFVSTSFCVPCVLGYLSSPHVGQEPPYSRDAQQSPVITSPVVPAPTPGNRLSHDENGDQ